MSVARKKKAAKAALKTPAAKHEPSPALKAQLEASIKEHTFITAKVRGHLVACEHQVISELSQAIERALWPVSDFFLEDFKGIAGGLSPPLALKREGPGARRFLHQVAGQKSRGHHDGTR